MRERLGVRAFLDHKDHLVQRELKVILVTGDTVVIPDLKEMPGQQVPPDPLDTLDL